MSELTHPGHADFIAEAQRLLKAIQSSTGEDRTHAEHELSHFLRMNAAGRLAEYFAARRAPDGGEA
jgi:hypothetical protein